MGWFRKGQNAQCLQSAGQRGQHRTGHGKKFDSVGRSLADLKPNQYGRVKRCLADGHLGQKLISMGLFPGAEVHMIRNAPLLDPIEIEVQNYLVVLRRSEAALIEVETA